MAIIYLLLFVSPQILLYLYLRERLPNPSRPRQARLIRRILAVVFTVFNLPWLIVAVRMFSGSLWGISRISYIAPWIAWQLMGWVFCGLVTLYVFGKLVLAGSRELGAVLGRLRRTSTLRRSQPLPAPWSHEGSSSPARPTRTPPRASGCRPMGSGAPSAFP